MASPLRKEQLSATPRLAAFLWAYFMTRPSISTNVAESAPRLIASSPSAPVPENKSSTSASISDSRLSNRLNIASRVLSVDGLVVFPSGADNCRRRRKPPMMRMLGLGIWWSQRLFTRPMPAPLRGRFRCMVRRPRNQIPKTGCLRQDRR